MTNPIAVSQRARECLATAYEQSGHRDEAAAFRAGEWTCHDHPALVAMMRFEAEIRADATAMERAACADLAGSIGDNLAQDAKRRLDQEEVALRIMQADGAWAARNAIRNQKDRDHE